MNKLSFITAPISCPICCGEGIQSFATGTAIDKKINKSNCLYFKMECQKQHVFWGIPLLPDYSYFLRNGLASFNSGNYYESFSSAYSAYERFKMTFCEAILLNNNENNYAKMEEQAEPFLKNSNNIAGAFSALYAMYFHSTCTTDLSNKNRNKRNNIVHGVEYPDERTVKKIFTKIIKFIHDVEWSFVSKQHEQNYDILHYPIMDLVEERKKVITDHLITNDHVQKDKILSTYSEFLFNEKEILPVGNQKPINLDESDFTFEDMTKAFNNLHNNHLKIMESNFQIN